MICNIFAGADISDYSWVKPENGYNIAADRGLIHCQRLGIAPDLILGDFDSYGGKLPENADILRAPAEKDDTDTMLAVKCGFERGCDDFRIYGGLGGRFGHTAANIQTLMYIMSHGGKGYLYGGEYDMPIGITYTDEQSEELKTYTNDIVTYIGENYFAFIDGSKPISEWDNYVNDLKEFGIDRCAEIVQEAYEAYIA